jgi:hypothetical protein
MSLATDKLIAELAGHATPVRRLWPPMVRALAWLAAVAAISLGLILAYAHLAVFAQRASDPRMAVELAATLATGMAGVIAAFHLSLPDRSRAWAWLPAPFAALWMSLSGLGCYTHWAEQDARGWALGQSSSCFLFILAVGVPLAACLALGLRRSSPLQPRLTAALGAVGIAGLSAFILQFFHPFDVTLLDLGAHLAAVLVIVALMTVTARSPAGRIKP